MRYCNFCHRLTTGQPLFCNFCGRSYDVKLCPSRHINPRAATICSECGSRDLSTPQPPISFSRIVLFRFLRILPGVLLLLVTVAFFFGLVSALLHNITVQRQALGAGLLLALLWWLYLHLPGFVRHGLQRFIRRGKAGKGGSHGHHG